VAQIPARQAKKENYNQSAVFLVKISDCDNCHAKPQLLTNDKGKLKMPTVRQLSFRP